MRFNPIKVLIVHDSGEFRALLQKAMAGDRSLEVVGSVPGAKEAEKFIRETPPDAVVLQVSQLGGRTAETIGRIDPSGNLFILLVGAQPLVLPPLSRRGEVDFARLPGSRNPGDFSIFCNEVCVKLKISGKPLKKHIVPMLSAAESKPETPERQWIIAIGASTGGTEATAEIIKHLPAGLPGIVIVQHMPPGFTKMYAERLDSISQLHVSEARDGDRVEAGTAFVAEGGKHLTVKKDAQGYYLKCFAGERVNGHCPSVGLMFDSVAEAAGPDALGVILTGMGRDGAEGLLHMRNAGAFTVGQDQETCVVYGMPMVAYDIGGVVQQAPLGDIAGIITNFFK